MKSNKALKKYPRWMTPKTKRAKSQIVSMWKRYKESGSSNDWVEYKIVLNKTTSCYKDAKRKFEVNLANKVKTSPKPFYSYVRSRSKTKDVVGPLKDPSGKVMTDNSETCKMLNDYFSSVFTEEDTTVLPVPEAVYKDDPKNMLNNINITLNDVYEKLIHLKSDKAPGPDGIVPKLLIETASSVCIPLWIIFIKSLQCGDLPNDWKCANVTPIYKKGDKSCPGNYRPVSLTSQVCKMLESIIKDNIIAHLNKFALINSSQHGFTSGRSCLTNLLEFFEYVLQNIGKGHAVDVVYLDFQKAFDKVPHQRLLSKLVSHGISGAVVNWIGGRLRDRRQRVVLNGCKSEWGNVFSGVPQGSVLGPTLFIIYVNDFDSNILSMLSKFADDAKLYRSVSSIHQVTLLQADLDKLLDWSEEWQMEFNVEKCKVMHFGKSNSKSNYTIGNSTLQVVTYEKDLGVIVQDDLKVSMQCSEVVKKANKILGMIKRTFTSRSKEIILRLYKFLVRPHLDYCAQAWRPHLQKEINMLEKVQRRATRMIEGLGKMSYEDRLQELNLTTLETRRVRGDLLEMFKIVKGLDRIDYADFITFSSSELRGHSCKLFKPRVLTNFGKFSFSFRVIEEWNMLTQEIVLCNTVMQFKSKLDHYLRFCRGFI